MTRDFTKIAEDSKKERERLSSQTYPQPVTYSRELFSDLDDYFSAHLKAMEKEAENLDEANLSEDDKYESQRSYFKQLHRIRRYREQIHSENIPIELYHFVDSVIGELNPDNKFYVISTNNRVKNNRFDSLLHTTFESLDKYNKKVLNLNPILLQLPRNEMDSPFTYCLIPHEIFHNMKITEELKEDFNYVNKEISDSEKEELVVDALTLNYMGPSYAISLIDLYDRIKEEDVESYPPIETRRGYLLEYLNYLQSNFETSKIHEDIIDTVKSEIAQKRGDETPNYIISDFELFNKDVVSKMNKQGIPVFSQRLNELREGFQMNSIESGRLRKKIDILIDHHDSFGRSDGALPVSMAIQPVILFNVLLLAEDRHEDNLVTCVLSSLRKWYARREYEMN